MGPGYGYFFLISDGEYGLNYFLYIAWWKREREREREWERDIECTVDRDRDSEIERVVERDRYMI